MKRIATLVGLLAVLAFPVVATATDYTPAHTGSLYIETNCEEGTNVHVVLDANVAAEATWRLQINEADVANGTGPGPVTFGAVNAGFDAGSAELTIEFQEEQNTYDLEWDAVEPCPAPIATPKPTPKPAAGGVSSTSRTLPTLPETSTER